MIVVEKNQGTKIPYEVDGTRITFADDLTLNLAQREKDWPVHIDICADAAGALVIGTSVGRAYVAQIDIPARQYTYTEVPEPVAEANGLMSMQQEVIPLDMEGVTLSLWAVV